MNKTFDTGGLRRRSLMGFPSEPVADPQAAWQEAVANDRGGMRTLYIHIPFCRSRCLFCPFYFGATDRRGMKSYVGLLIQELQNAAPELKRYPINAIYFGGGTPTDMDPEDFAAILSSLQWNYWLTNDCEITVEGRITGFSDDKIKTCLDHGVNRFSLGVQTFDTDLRRSLGRTAERQKVIALLRKLSNANQASVVIDLLYGLPGQTLEQWLEDQRIVLNEVPISGLDHYRLTIHDRLPLAQAIASGKLPALPDEDACWEMYQTGEEMMQSAGAVRLSIKHYALDCRERNVNNDISGRKNICLPFGVHAGGRLGDYQFHQTNDLVAYRRAVEAGLKPLERAGRVLPDHHVCAELAGHISRQRGINLARAAELGGEKRSRIVELGSAVLSDWQSRKFVQPEQYGWQCLTGKGMFLHKELGSELMESIAQAWEK